MRNIRYQKPNFAHFPSMHSEVASQMPPQTSLISELLRSMLFESSSPFWSDSVESASFPAPRIGFLTMSSSSAASAFDISFYPSKAYEGERRGKDSSEDCLTYMSIGLSSYVDSGLLSTTRFVLPLKRY